MASARPTARSASAASIGRRDDREVEDAVDVTILRHRPRLAPAVGGAGHDDAQLGLEVEERLDDARHATEFRPCGVEAGDVGTPDAGPCRRSPSRAVFTTAPPSSTPCRTDRPTAVEPLPTDRRAPRTARSGTRCRRGSASRRCDPGRCAPRRAPVPPSHRDRRDGRAPPPGGFSNSVVTTSQSSVRRCSVAGSS